METESTRAISEVKQELRLREWSEQIERQQSSGMSVEQWCVENGIKPKTYYSNRTNQQDTKQDLNQPIQSEGATAEKAVSMASGKA